MCLFATRGKPPVFCLENKLENRHAHGPIMVLKSYDDIDEEYQGIKAEASRPQACTVMIMVAPEVGIY